MREGKQWTKEEEDRLVKYFKRGKTAKEVSIELGRNMTAIYQRKYVLRDRFNSKSWGPWTDQEKLELRRKYKEGKSDKEISKELGRTINAVARIRTSMNLNRREVSYWTDEEDERLRALIRAGESDNKIARTLGRSKSAITQRRTAINRAANKLKGTKETPTKEGLDVKTELFKKGQDYLVKTTGTGILNRQETSREIATYKGNTDDLLIFERENYTETYTKVDIALGEVSIREATKTDYQTIQ